jgi:hypothetical protein
MHENFLWLPGGGFICPVMGNLGMLRKYARAMLANIIF